MRTARMLLAVVVLLGLGCTPWRGIYLSASTNAATQDEISQKLGPPHQPARWRTAIRYGSTSTWGDMRAAGSAESTY